MTPNEAAAALDAIDRTDKSLAARARWPFLRHAAFGLAEGLIVAAMAQPIARAGAMILVAMLLIIACVADDRRRHGFFVSGWHPVSTRTTTVLVTLFVLLMAAGSAAMRDGSGGATLGFVLGAVTVVICTAASLYWEKVYRAGLMNRSGT